MSVREARDRGEGEGADFNQNRLFYIQYKCTTNMCPLIKLMRSWLEYFW